MSLLKYAPAVYAVGNDYVVCVRVTEPCVMWIEAGGECFYDDSNGILRSRTELHKMTLPQKHINDNGKYTVCYRRMIERKPYFSQLEDVTRVEFSFRPVGNSARAYHVADAHGVVDGTIASAKHYEELFGEIDFLILNGDVIDHSGDIANFDAIYEIASEITHGEKPIVFSRGNHDTRGIYAENIADYTPTRAGFSYFTFRLGGIWGIVLDCGEDKDDSSDEYGHTVACHQFRVRETKYLQSVIENAEREYLAEGVRLRIVVSHSPFTKIQNAPFDIEQDIYAKWTELLSDSVKPNLMISGHLHSIELLTPGSADDAYGQKFPVAVASLVDRKTRVHTGAGFELSEGRVRVACVNKDKIVKEFEI